MGWQFATSRRRWQFFDDKKCFNGDPQQFTFRTIMLHGCVGCYTCHFICGVTARSSLVTLETHVDKAAQNDQDQLHLHCHSLSPHLLWSLKLLMTELLQSGSTTVHCQNHQVRWLHCAAPAISSDTWLLQQQRGGVADWSMLFYAPYYLKLFSEVVGMWYSWKLSILFF